jgi:lipopolysaccharide export system protein LptC
LGQEPERFGVAGTGQQTGARGQGAIGRDPRARAYEQARRHSARVRFYKRVIPIGTAVAVAALVAFALAAPSGPGGLSLGPISFSGTKVTMESPKMTGFHKDKRPYEVTATSATQDVRKPNVIELNQMRGRLVVDDNGRMCVSRPTRATPHVSSRPRSTSRPALSARARPSRSR